MKHPRGVRSRLLVAVVVSVAIAVAAMTAGFNVLLARSLSHDVDSVVRARAETEAAAVDVVNDRVTTPDQPDSGGLESQAWVFRDTRVVEKPSVSEALSRAAQGAAATPGVMVTAPGLHTRLYATPASDFPGVTVVAGVSLVPYERTQRIALLGSLILAGLLLLVVALVTRWMLRQALSPVARMTADAESWSEHDLGRRFAAGEPYDELSQLAATLDGLLDGLSASLRHEQRFSAEMSHELRTPLAKVRTEAELALRHPRQTEEYRAALETIVRNTRQMTATVETLVAASQQESGLARGRCDAAPVLEEAAETCAGLAAGRGVHVAVVAPAGPLTLGVEAEVALRVLTPLLENACHFAHAEVTLSAHRDGTVVSLLVDDDGPGVLLAEAESIFEPGVRGSAAAAGKPRDADEVAGAPAGAGLGLALARRLARAAGGNVVATAGNGGHFVARLPAG
jgi:two-component system OmpR family sensor kinase